MKNAYLSRQVFFAFNQFAIICYLGFMAAQNDFIQQNSFVHFLLLSFLIFDGLSATLYCPKGTFPTTTSKKSLGWFVFSKPEI